MADVAGSNLDGTGSGNMDLFAQAEQAAMVARSGDWGPVFVYGTMMAPAAWGKLLGHVPDMRAATLRGYSRHPVHSASFAGLMKNETRLVVGQTVLGLQPRERRLLDAVVDDGFELQDVQVRFLDDPDGPPVSCTTYVWRPSYTDALQTEADWDFDDFSNGEDFQDFLGLCSDMRASHAADKMSDEELKNMSLVRRRRGDMQPADSFFDPQAPPSEMAAASAASAEAGADEEDYGDEEAGEEAEEEAEEGEEGEDVEQEDGTE